MECLAIGSCLTTTPQLVPSIERVTILTYIANPIAGLFGTDAQVGDSACLLLETLDVIWLSGSIDQLYKTTFVTVIQRGANQLFSPK